MVLFCPYGAEDPAFRASGRLPNLLYGDRVRGIWITRFEFHSREDIVRAIDRCSLAGFNTVFFQVRGNATAYYPSNLEPWSEVYEWRDPGFDPLQVAVSEAHAHNMALHAWVNVMPMWRGLHPPTNSTQLFNSRPEWSWYNKAQVRQPLNKGFYVSINPCLPDARKHIVAVCKEIVSGYDIDGLHLDYIRFPNETPVVNGGEYPRDKITVKLFHKATGVLPDMDHQLWSQWRADCVTEMLRDIRRSVKSVRPQLVLTAAVGADRRQALSKFQDVGQWWKERLLDAVIPMNYTGCQKTFRFRVDHEWMGSFKKRHFSLMTRMYRQACSNNMDHGGRIVRARLPEPAVIMGTSLEFGDSSLHKRQLSLALNRFGHFSVFCYSTLFGLGNKESLDRHSLLLPFLRLLEKVSKVPVTKDPQASYLSSLRTGLVQFQYKVLNRLQTQIPDWLSCRLAFRRIDDHHAEIVASGKKRQVLTITNKKSRNPNRRTYRRLLLQKHLKKAQQLTMKLPTDSSPLVGTEIDGPMPMSNWESVKMSQAIGEADDYLVERSFHFNTNLLVPVPQSWLSTDKFHCMLEPNVLALSYTNKPCVQNKEVICSSSLISELAKSLISNWIVTQIDSS